MKRRLVLLGPAASGKGTLADRLAEGFGFAVVSPGAIRRTEKEAATEFGKNADLITAGGQLLDDDSFNTLMGHRLDNQRSERFVFDGYPRTVGQRWFLEKSLNSRDTLLEKVIYLEADAATSSGRVVKRAGCRSCGKILSRSYGQTTCDFGGEIFRRSNDTEEVLAVRITQYEQKTAPLIGFYEAHGILTKFDATAPADDVFQSVKTAIL